MIPKAWSSIDLWFSGWNFQITISQEWGMGGEIDMEWKFYESIGCWTHYVTLNYGLTLGFDLGFLRLISLNNHISRMWELIDMERKVCESIGCCTHCLTLNFDYTHWHGIFGFKFSFRNIFTSGMDCPFDLKWNEYKLIAWCLLYVLPWSLALSMTSILEFQGEILQITISQELSQI